MNHAIGWEGGSQSRPQLLLLLCYRTVVIVLSEHLYVFQAIGLIEARVAGLELVKDMTEGRRLGSFSSGILLQLWVIRVERLRVEEWFLA